MKAGIEAFTYKPIEIPRPRPVPAEPLALEIPKLPAEPVLPPHDAAWEPQAPERPWRWIVVHHSASDTGSAAAFDAYHRNGRHWDELGYHFVIGNGGGSGDGLVEVGPRWPKQKWGAHCRVGDNEEYNYFGIGICLVGNFDKHRPTEPQMASLARLVDYLAARYHIDDAHIIGHGTVDDTRCPGQCFSMGDLLARVHRLRAAREGLAAARAP
jgi:N-acetyl-anhydromuramyl-L-alanine amidase AmpD